MTNPSVALIVLAAGAGTRMKSAIPKPLHPVAGLPMVEHVLRAGMGANPVQTVLVASPHTQAIVAFLPNGDDIVTIVQDPPRGTGDAVSVGLSAIADSVDRVVVLYADHPLLTPGTVSNLVEGALTNQSRVTVLTCLLADASGYGRIARDESGNPVRIVEKSDDRAEDRVGMVEVNSGMMVLDARWARERLAAMPPSPVSGEFYLTDLVDIAVREADADSPWPVSTVAGDPTIAIGINDRVQLAEADAVLRDRIRQHHQRNGVTITLPQTVLIDADVTIGRDTTILPGSVILRGTTIGSGCTVGPTAVLDRARIGDGVVVRSSTVTDSSVGDRSDVGPYAHVRGGTAIASDVHIGNFGEFKNAEIDPHVKVGHHSYIGDAHIGEGTNIGAGAITCNYDGTSKHHTEIGRRVFIGSDTMLVAPITIGDDGRTGAGSVVTKDVAPGVTVVGMPARPIRRRVPQPEQMTGED